MEWWRNNPERVPPRPSFSAPRFFSGPGGGELAPPPRLEDTKPFTPARRKAQLQRTLDKGFDRSRFNAASEPVTSDTGVPDNLIEALAARKNGAAMAKSVATDLNLPVNTPDEATHTAGAAMAGAIAGDLGLPLEDR